MKQDAWTEDAGPRAQDPAQTGVPPPGSSALRAPRLGLWIAAARPKTLLLSVAPVAAGIALGVAQTGGLALAAALTTLVAALAIQVGTNLHNDAADFERGADTRERLGPPRATAQGWFSARQVRTAAHLAFGIALLLGLLLVVRGGWPILALGITAIACGYGYTSGRRPIAYGPFGELYVLAFFGIAAVVGSHYLQVLGFDWSALLLGTALGLPAAAVLLLNNYRDLETDRAAGRRTLCHYLGRPRCRVLYAAFVILPLPMLLVAGLPGPVWLSLAALPLALRLVRRLFGGASGRDLNSLLGLTALYQALITGLLLASFALATRW